VAQRILSEEVGSETTYKEIKEAPVRRSFSSGFSFTLPGGDFIDKGPRPELVEGKVLEKACLQAG